MDGALNMLSAMFGAGGISFPADFSSRLGHVGNWLSENGALFIGNQFTSNDIGDGLMMLTGLLGMAWFALNTQQIMIHHDAALETYPGEIKRSRLAWLVWRPSVFWLLIIVAITLKAVHGIAGHMEFLYFNF